MNQEQDNFNSEDMKGSPEIQAQNTTEQEPQLSLESIDALTLYESKKEEVQVRLAEVSHNVEILTEKLKEVRESLNLPDNENVPSVDKLRGEQDSLKQEQIKVSANYPGDWTLLLRDRMLDPITKEKFIQTRKDAMVDMKEGQIPPKSEDGLNYIKETTYQEYYQKQIDNYDQNVKKIFNSTNIENSSAYSKDPHHLGKGGIGFEGAVFSDAQRLGGVELSNRDKNIIEAHEKGHGLRDFVSTDAHDFRQSIDLDVVRQNDLETDKRQIGYLRTADEIAERMAQLKNYFGFKAGDTFTRDHLKYAADHYVNDTGLDNNMTVFLKAITERTVDKFIDTINKYPL